MNETVIEIRHGVVADAAALSQIGMDTFRKAYAGSAAADDIESHIQHYFSVAAIKEELLSPGRSYLLAMLGNRAAGFLKLRSGDCPDEIPAENCIRLEQLYVAPGHQRHGVGRRLLQATIAAAQSELAAGVWLTVWEQADWATSFYRKNNFTQVGNAVFQIGATRHVDLLMWLPVAQPD